MDLYLNLPDAYRPELPDTARVLFVAPGGSTSVELDTLKNIIKACGLEEGTHAAIVGLPGGVRLDTHSLAHEIDHVVCFAIEPARLGLFAEITPYLWTAPVGGRRYCFAERLSVIGEDMDREKLLWATVKSLKTLPKS